MEGETFAYRKPLSRLDDIEPPAPRKLPTMMNNKIGMGEGPKSRKFAAIRKAKDDDKIPSKRLQPLDNRSTPTKEFKDATTPPPPDLSSFSPSTGASAIMLANFPSPHTPATLLDGSLSQTRSTLGGEDEDFSVETQEKWRTKSETEKEREQKKLQDRIVELERKVKQKKLQGLQRSVDSPEPHLEDLAPPALTPPTPNISSSQHLGKLTANDNLTRKARTPSPAGTRSKVAEAIALANKLNDDLPPPAVATRSNKNGERERASSTPPRISPPYSPEQPSIAESRSGANSRQGGGHASSEFSTDASADELAPLYDDASTDNDEHENEHVQQHQLDEGDEGPDAIDPCTLYEEDDDIPPPTVTGEKEEGPTTTTTTTAEMEEEAATTEKLPTDEQEPEKDEPSPIVGIEWQQQVELAAKAAALEDEFNKHSYQLQLTQCEQGEAEARHVVTNLQHVEHVEHTQACAAQGGHIISSQLQAHESDESKARDMVHSEQHQQFGELSNHYADQVTSLREAAEASQQQADEQSIDEAAVTHIVQEEAECRIGMTKLVNNEYEELAKSLDVETALLKQKLIARALELERIIAEIEGHMKCLREEEAQRRPNVESAIFEQFVHSVTPLVEWRETDCRNMLQTDANDQLTRLLTERRNVEQSKEFQGTVVASQKRYQKSAHVVQRFFHRVVAKRYALRIKAILELEEEEETLRWDLGDDEENERGEFEQDFYDERRKLRPKTQRLPPLQAQPGTHHHHHPHPHHHPHHQHHPQPVAHPNQMSAPTSSSHFPHHGGKPVMATHSPSHQHAHAHHHQHVSPQHIHPTHVQQHPQQHFSPHQHVNPGQAVHGHHGHHLQHMQHMQQAHLYNQQHGSPNNLQQQHHQHQPRHQHQQLQQTPQPRHSHRSHDQSNLLQYNAPPEPMGSSASGSLASTPSDNKTKWDEYSDWRTDESTDDEHEQQAQPQPHQHVGGVRESQESTSSTTSGKAIYPARPGSSIQPLMSKPPPDAEDVLQVNAEMPSPAYAALSREESSQGWIECSPDAQGGQGGPPPATFRRLGNNENASRAVTPPLQLRIPASDYSPDLCTKAPHKEILAVCLGSDPEVIKKFKGKQPMNIPDSPPHDLEFPHEENTWTRTSQDSNDRDDEPPKCVEIDAHHVNHKHKASNNNKVKQQQGQGQQQSSGLNNSTNSNLNVSASDSGLRRSWALESVSMSNESESGSLATFRELLNLDNDEEIRRFNILQTEYAMREALLLDLVFTLTDRITHEEAYGRSVLFLDFQAGPEETNGAAAPDTED